jgi:threonine dehydrogenase-like Zn-dependent dehydrogenase
MAGKARSGQEALVLGAGPVGRAAAKRLSVLGFTPVFYDLNQKKSRLAARELAGAKIAIEGERALPGDFNLFLEATSGGPLWPEDKIKTGSAVSAPGMPRSFAPSLRYKLWHEPLATGTAVMIAEAVFFPNSF